MIYCFNLISFGLTGLTILFIIDLNRDTLSFSDYLLQPKHDVYQDLPGTSQEISDIINLNERLYIDFKGPENINT